jgi:hypothetical protein
MDDGEATTPDEPDLTVEAPAAPPALEPPPMPAPLPPPPVSPESPVAASKRSFPWVTVVVGVIAVAAIVVLSVMVVTASSDKNDAEEALANAHSDLADAKSNLADSDAALATAESDLSDAQAALADAETARSDAEAAQAEAEAARDDHQQRADEYEAASADFLAASFVQGLGLEEGDAQCVASGLIESLGAEAMTILASAARDGSGNVDKLDDEMRRVAEDCDVSSDVFDDSFGSVDPAANAYGDDPQLDALYDDCAAGDATACDDLYVQSTPGSEYEQFAGTCGDRFEYSDTEYCEGRF